MLERTRSLSRRDRRPAPALSAAVAAAALLCLAPAAPAQAKVTVGVSQQTPGFFNSPQWRALRAPAVRYVTPYDSALQPAARAALDQWMAAAASAHADVTLALTSSQLTRTLPTRGQYRVAFLALRARYPRVRRWVPWNETNHPTAPTGRHPDRAAAFFNIAARNCAHCQVAAGDVLDISNLRSWVRRYRRHLTVHPKIWSMHNYHDANGLTAKGVRAMLGVVKGRIWLTEAGGLVRINVGSGRYKVKRNYGTRHAALATRHLLDLSRRFKRIERIYVYNWNAPANPRTATWDSGLVDQRLRPRPAYWALRSWLAHARRRHLAR
jgi:hypothetical protein